MADAIPLLLLKAEDKNLWSVILHYVDGRTTTLPCATPAEHLIAASEIDYRPYRREIQTLREQHPLFEARFEAVIFVNGCFWHGHQGCKYYTLPKTNIEFWKNKIERNRNRDLAERQKIVSMGWHCITIWECQLKPKVRQQTLEALVYTLSHIFLEDRRIEPYKEREEDLTMVADSTVGYESKSLDN